MLSILIPIYNERVVDLVSSLQRQCEALPLLYEIICIDDCSSNDIQEQNEKDLLKLNVNYQVLEQNVGRSRIRNKLIDSANYQYLLFIDSDHQVISDHYIAAYVHHISNAAWTLIYGGTTYAKEEPESDKILHWYYGRKREAISARMRNIDSANHIHTNNLLIRMSRLDGIRFDDGIIGYGYEDLVFGQQIKRAGLTIIHLDNPLLHIGLKTNENFLSDLKQASCNLSRLYTQGKINDLKITRTVESLKRWFLLYPVIFLLTYIESLLIYLVKKYPRQLYLVDALRLLYFAQETKTHHKY